jgi:translation initiation factor IF-2
MANERIHKLAAEWGTTSKEIIERLERMGIKGKKAQSGLTESEARRVYDEMGLHGDSESDAPVVTHRTVEVRDSGVGDTITAVDTITETRVKRGVVLRRTKRTSLDRGNVTIPTIPLPPANVRAATAVALTPDTLASFDQSEFAYASGSAAAVQIVAPEPAAVEVEPEPAEIEPSAPAPVVEFEIAQGGETADSEAAEEVAAEVEAAAPESADAEVEPVAAEPERPVAAPEPPAEAEEEEEEEFVPIDEPDKLAEEMLSRAEARENGAQAGEEGKPATGAARVLGRIDLTRKAKPVMPEQKKEEEPKSEDDKKPGRKKKRKVVRKEDMFDAFERSVAGRNRRPMKKRVAPGQRTAKTELTTPKASKRVIKVNEVSTAGELAKSMSVKAGEVLGALMRLGVMKSINDPLDFDTVTLVAEEFDYTVENTAINVDEILQVEPADEDAAAAASLPRAPVVTVMGHVDHGKTSLLDVIRKANVVASESGGITQHIGAYNVPTAQGEICFLDTPGHAAFTTMRARGASVTDIVILVVAADDGAMPQTIEAVNHAKAAEIPVVVAVNKMDKPDANPDRIKQQLSELGLQPEDWGGETQFVPVSAIQQTGIDELLEAVSLVAQMLELTAPVERAAHGTVIEAKLDKGRGPVATVLVQEGTLNRGDYYVVGETTGRVRAMVDDMGRQVKQALPSHAVEIIGLDSVPEAGDSFDAVADPSKAEQVAEHRREIAVKQKAAVSARMSLEDLQRQVAAGDVSELRVIIKADVQGSAEALKQALEKLTNQEVALNVIHVGVGAINESDVQLAMASQAIIVGFHVRPEAKARALAEREGVDLRLHTIIYEVIDEVTAALEGLLAPEFREAFEGRAEVRDTFSVPGGTVIAGSYVTDGKITRNAQCRLLRDNVVIHTGTVGSLRRFKDDVREVQTSYECGIGLDRYNDIKVGDVIECFRMDEIKRSLESAAATAEPETPEEAPA